LTRITEWAGQAVKRGGWNLGPRAALGGLALISGLALLAAFYLVLSSHTALLGRRIQDMESKKESFIYENADLRDQINRSASVTKLTEKALSEGYVVTGTVLFVPVALDWVRDKLPSLGPP